uniref:Uncharacterized protein n=1 Tax=Oryza punctata TaxID=4537 RepID=A0A0E0KDA5_ORYPU
MISRRHCTILLSNLLKDPITTKKKKRRYIYNPKHHADPLLTSSTLSFLFPSTLTPEFSRFPFSTRDRRCSPPPSPPRRRDPSPLRRELAGISPSPLSFSLGDDVGSVWQRATESAAFELELSGDERKLRGADPASCSPDLAKLERRRGPQIRQASSPAAVVGLPFLRPLAARATTTTDLPVSGDATTTAATGFEVDEELFLW